MEKSLTNFRYRYIFRALPKPIDERSLQIDKSVRQHSPGTEIFDRRGDDAYQSLIWHLYSQ